MRRVRGVRPAKCCGRAPKKAATMCAGGRAKRGNRRRRGRDVVSQQKEQFRAAYEAGRQAYHEATTETGAPKNL
jgi:hypothetical protein